MFDRPQRKRAHGDYDSKSLERWVEEKLRLVKEGVSEKLKSTHEKDSKKYHKSKGPEVETI